MKQIVAVIAVFGVGLGAWILIPAGTSTVHAGDGTPAVALAPDENDVAVEMSSVPAAVVSAASAKLPGIAFTSAEREVERGVTLYSLTGTVNGKRYEIEVTADGKVVEVEDEEDDDDDDDDDDHDD